MSLVQRNAQEQEYRTSAALELVRDFLGELDAQGRSRQRYLCVSAYKE